MTTPIIASGAAALALYVYLKQRGATASAPEGVAPALQMEACRDVEHPPNTWTEALYYFKEVFRYMYTETLGRWHTVDLFVGLAYLSHRESEDYAATDIIKRGQPISLDLSSHDSIALLAELKEIRRYLLYCRGLKYRRADLQLQFWQQHLGLDNSCVIRQQAIAGLLRPAYVLVRDEPLKSVVLCVRGTQSMKDLFTSLAAATKPHHKIQANGVVLGYSHLGMLAAARWIMKQLAPVLKATMADNPGYQLRIVGHSMGGGTAAMLTTMLRETVPELSDTKCYAIACPACMTLELASSCKDYVTSVINGTDIVPTFSGASVDALREDVMHSSWFAEFQRDLRASVYRALQGGIRGVGAATQWTSRNIIQSAYVPFRSCYNLRRFDAPAQYGNQPLDTDSGDDNPVNTPLLHTHDSSEGGACEDPHDNGSMPAPSGGHHLRYVDDQPSALSAAVMEQTLQSCLYAAGTHISRPEGANGDQRSRGGNGRGDVGQQAAMLLGTASDADNSNGTAASGPSTSGYLGDFSLLARARQAAASSSSTLSTQQLRKHLWPWVTGLADDDQAGPGTSEDADGRGDTAHGGSSETGPSPRSPSYAGWWGSRPRAITGSTMSWAQRAGASSSWLWQGMFRACTMPRHGLATGVGRLQPMNSDDMPWGEGAEPHMPGAGAAADMENLDEDGEVADAVGGADGLQGSSESQLQAGITAVVAAVTQEQDVDQAAVNEVEAAESMLRETEGPATSLTAAAAALDTDPFVARRSTPGRPVRYGSAGRRRRPDPTATEATGSPSAEIAAARSSDDAMAAASGRASLPGGVDAATAHRSTPSARMPSTTNRLLYPAGRILHFFPAHAAAPVLSDRAVTTSGCAVSVEPSSSLQSAAVGAALESADPVLQGAEHAAAAATAATQHVLFEVAENHAYGRVRLCKTMVSDHFTPSYLVALDSVVAQLEAQLRRS